MDFLKAGIKQDIVTALRNSPLHLSSLFPDHLLAKAKEEISHHEQKHSANTQKKPARFDAYSQSGRQAPEADLESGILAWKQLKHQGQSKRG